MADFSQMSDEDILRLYQSPAPAPVQSVPQTAQPAPDLGSLSDADLLAHYSAAPAPQMEGLAREAALPASAAAKGALSSLSLPGEALRSGINLYSKYVGAPTQQLLTGNQNPPVFSGHNPIDAETLMGAGRNAGLIDRPDLAPQTERERLESGAAEGIGSVAVPGGLARGGIGMTRLLATGAGAGAGAELGKEVAPDHPIIGSLIGGLAGGKMAGGGYSLLAKGANAAQGVTSPVIAAYQRLGIAPELLGDVTGSPGAQQLQAFASKAPGGAGRIEAAGERAVTGFQDAVDRTASNLGTSRSAQDAGTVLQNEGKGWLNNFRQQGQQVWGAVAQQIPPTTRVSIHNYDSSLQQIGSDLADASQTAKTLQPALSRQLFEALQSDAGPTGTLSWKAVSGIRSRIGEMLSDPNLPADTSHAELKRLYGALSSDLQTAATNAGPQAATAYQAANTFTRNGHAFIDNTLRPFVRDGVAPEQAADSALRGGDTSLQALRQQMPKAADELAAYKLRDMALAKPGQAGASGDATSPGTFLTDLNSFRQNAPVGHRALFADPRAAQAVDDLSTVADSIKKTAGRLNTSGTGAHNQMAAMIGLSEAVPAAIAGHEVGGVSGAIAGALGATALPFGAANLAARTASYGPLTRLLSTPIANGRVPLSSMAPRVLAPAYAANIGQAPPPRLLPGP